MKKYKILLFGGDRLREAGPCSILADFLKKNKIEYLIITDKGHFKKKISNNETFGTRLIKQKHNFIVEKKIQKKNIQNFINKKTLGLSINSIWKFNKQVIKLFNGNLYNYHAADLPTERGAGNISWRILMNKNKNISINIHAVDRNFDTGNIVSQNKLKINKFRYNPIDHLKEIKNVENKLLKKFVLDYIKNKKFMKRKQNNKKGYYWPRLKSDKDGKINWSWSSLDIISFIRAFSHPYNGAFSFISGKKIRIFKAIFKKSKYKFHPFQNGIIFRVEKDKIYIASGKNEIIIDRKYTKNFNKDLKSYLGKRFIDEK